MSELNHQGMFVKSESKQILYPFSVHVVTFTFHYQLMHLLIKNPFIVHI